MTETLEVNTITTDTEQTGTNIKESHCFEYNGQRIIIADDERYIGTIISADGSRNHHLILLPGDADEANWETQMNWAKNIGGELPDRVESALLFATMKDEFKADWYWTREPHASDASYAWYQLFGNGIQTYGRAASTRRARAVRRLPI